MYQSLPYYSTYDNMIERHTQKIMAEMVSQSFEKSEQVFWHEIVEKNGKPKSRKQLCVHAKDYCKAHAQRLSTFPGSQPQEVIEKDLMTAVTEALNTVTGLC